MKPAVILSAIALAVGWHVMAISSGTAAIDGVKVAKDSQDVLSTSLPDG